MKKIRTFLEGLDRWEWSVVISALLSTIIIVVLLLGEFTMIIIGKSDKIDAFATPMEVIFYISIIHQISNSSTVLPL